MRAAPNRSAVEIAVRTKHDIAFGGIAVRRAIEGVDHGFRRRRRKGGRNGQECSGYGCNAQRENVRFHGRATAQRVAMMLMDGSSPTNAAVCGGMLSAFGQRRSRVPYYSGIIM